MHGFKAFADCDQPKCESCLRFMERNKLRQRLPYGYYETPKKIAKSPRADGLSASTLRMRELRKRRRQA